MILKAHERASATRIEAPCNAFREALFNECYSCIKVVRPLHVLCDTFVSAMFLLVMRHACNFPTVDVMVVLSERTDHATVDRRAKLNDVDVLFGDAFDDLKRQHQLLRNGKKVSNEVVKA